MDDLTTFLRARYDEEAETARAAAAKRGGGTWAAVLGDDGLTSVCGKGDGRSVPVILDPDDYETSLHVARHDPDRVLREVEAKRQMMRVAFEHAAAMDAEFGDCCDADVFERNGCKYTSTDELPLLRLLALPYADHPDCQEAWRP